jgi:hypothetical protein
VVTTYIWHGHGPRARPTITGMLKRLAFIVDYYRVGRGHAPTSIDRKPRMRVLRGDARKVEVLPWV